jgi:hypothetical protein
MYSFGLEGEREVSKANRAQKCSEVKSTALLFLSQSGLNERFFLRIWVSGVG